MSNLSAIFDDLRDRLVERLESEDLAVPRDARTSVQRALVAYLRVVHRSIRPRQRQVHWSKELGARLSILSADARGSLMRIATTLIRNWSPTQNASWSPTAYAYGSYTLRVETRRYGSTGNFEGVATQPFKYCSAAGGPCP